MAAGVKLATAYVQIVASAAGVRKDVAKELNLVAGDAEKTGRSSGKKMSAGLTKGADAKGFRKRLFSGVDKDAAGVGKRAGGRFKSGMSSAMKGFGAGLLAGIGTDKVVGLFRDATKGASDLEQSVGGVRAVFKDFAPQIERSSKQAAQALGLTKNEYNELATTLGAGLKNKGIKDFGKQTQDLIGIGADLSAQFGGSTQEAVDALASAMRGEMDPIEKYGISLNESALKAEALRLGLTKGKGTLSDNAKAQASLSLITRQSADAQGAFAREADTAAGKQARLRASWENLKTTLGEKLLPVVSTITGAANQFFVQMEKGTGVGGRFKDIVSGISSALRAAVDFITRYKGQLAALAIVVGTAAVAVKAYQVATKLATLWTARQAIAQGVLNAAMALNPIGLVVAALVALGVGLVIAYKKSETFRKIVNAAWAGIKKAAAATVTWFKQTAWPAMKTVFDAIGRTAKWLWTNAISPAFKAIGGVVKWLWQKIVRPYIGFVMAYWKTVFGWIKDTGWPWVSRAIGKIGGVVKWLWNNAVRPYFGKVLSNAKTVFGWIRDKGAPRVRAAFQAIGDKAKWLWDKGVKTPFSRIKSGVGAVKDAIVKARDGIKSAWSKLNDYLRDPIRKALSWMNTNFIGKLNTLLGKIPGVDLKIPTIPGFATGGYTGAGSKYQPAGVVHADEFVLRKEATNKLRRSIGLGGLDYMNRTGEMPGYAGGGYVYPSMVSWIKKKIPEAVITSTKRNWGGTSYHETGNAIDIGGSPALMQRIAQTIKSGFGSGITELIHNPGFSVKNGANVSSGFWGGSTWAAHRNHVHWAMKKMIPGAVLSAFGNMYEDPGWFGGQINKLIGKFGGDKYGLAGEIVPPALRRIGSALKDKVASLLSFSSDSGSAGSAPGGGVERWRGTVLKALGIMGLSPKYANSTLRRMQQESGGNVRAINNWDSNAAAGTPSKGLMQVIDPTFRAYAHPSYNRDIYDPLSNILASMRYAVARYGTLFAAYDRAGGYSGGGLVKPAVFDNGGTLAPGLNLVHNKLGKPEPLVRPEQMTPQVNISFAPGTEWLADFVQTEIAFADGFNSAHARMGV